MASGRKKGQSYRKEKFKEFKRIKCPEWTINEVLLQDVAHAAASIGVCQSRLVEVALKKILMEPSQLVNKNLKIEKLFTKT
ncbi:hypothetical protein [Sulfuricurvum sp.]|uniref:hypothetical protein n=1 Tax=Sulfuricurvum sp. TaxID=2025608 RepID=UPI002607F320|nr:hypothetical protein [Sulfuricurvum sp.]MDD2267479.1 hypothetical protein [Sulfuricurvum sp.]MDD2783973.1 hypothetical protein [Sulfuricurvum sp.]